MRVVGGGQRYSRLPGQAAQAGRGFVFLSHSVILDLQEKVFSEKLFKLQRLAQRAVVIVLDQPAGDIARHAAGQADESFGVSAQLCIVAFASVLTWQLSKPKQPLPTPATESVVSTHEEPDVAHFSFNDTPLPDVLSQLGRYYGVTLEANDSTRHLTGEFSGEQLDDIIGMIEEVLSVKITRH